MTAYNESASGLMVPLSLNGHGSPNPGYAAMIELYEATIRDLELQAREQGWLRLNTEGSQEFSRETIGEIVANARAYYLKNPLINRAVEVGALYVWGQDLTHSAEDEEVGSVIDRFWAINQATLTGQQASRLLEVELEVTGNVFLAQFADAVTGDLRVRMVPVEQIQAIVTNPEDRSDVWFYRRTWSQRKADGVTDEQMTAFHPDVRYNPASKPATAQWNQQDVPVMWGAPIRHVKAGAFLHWLWGVPEVYPALDWAKAYKTTLENDATRSAALARFAWKMTTDGGTAGVAAVKARIGTTFGIGSAETNPAPTASSTYIRGNKNQDLDAIDISKSILPVDHSRPIRLMAAAALGLPETFFGDADVGNHATAQTLDRPTELRYNERRQVWRDVFADLCQSAIDADIAATSGILRGRSLNEEQRTVNLTWPDLLEKSVIERVQAVREAATLNGQSLAGTMPRAMVARQIMVAIGIDDVDDAIAELEGEWDELDARREEMARQLKSNPGKTEPDGEERDQERESFIGALRELREALRVGAH